MNDSGTTPLAPRDLLVLSALADGPLHGYGIIKAVEEESRSGVLLDPGNLYRVLKRMRRYGWVEEPDPDGEDRRRVYRLTVHGRTVLQAELERLARLVRRVRPLLADGPGGWE
jgi:PadR family transcriptional regulator PadR